MRLIYCACGAQAQQFADASGRIPGAEYHALANVPTRKELRFLDAAAAECLPEDPTPSLAEIQASPNVSHMGEPQLAPQEPIERLRIIVHGSDAALGAVLTRMMRADYLWAEVAYIPLDTSSPAAVCWGAVTNSAFAVEAPVVPAACARTDAGEVVAGSATITHDDGSKEFIGEIVVDSQTLVLRTGGRSARFRGQFGARLVPTMSAPGIACAPLITRRGRTDGSRVLTGRAVQTGGQGISLLIDALPKPRLLTHATFYRHLRDIQSVRNA